MKAGRPIYFDALIDNPVKVFKKGSKGEVVTYFSSAREFYHAESMKRYNHVNIAHNSVYNSILAILRGSAKSMKSYHFGYDVVIKRVSE